MARRPRRPGRRVGTLLAWFIVMMAFTAFFVVPVIWVLIAPTKTDHQLVYQNPLAFGSVHTFLKTWDEIYAFQGRELMTWLGNSAKYSVGGVLLALACAVPAGYGLALTQFIGRRVLLSITLLVMIIRQCSGAAAFPGDEPGPSVELGLVLWSSPLAFSRSGFTLPIFSSRRRSPRGAGAARVDGCRRGVLWVALPLARP